MTLLHVDNIDVFYGKIQAIKGLSIDVKQGELVTLIGANGAGKSTTLRAISGLEKVSRGDIRFKNQSIKQFSASKITSKGIIHAPEGRRVFTRLSVLENLELGAYLRKDKKSIKKDMQRVYEFFPILFERNHQKAGTLSGGEQQMLAIARALMAKPEVLLLDEPSLGLAPLIVEQIMGIIYRVKEEGMSILLVEQNARQALKIADRAYVIETSSITISGEASSLINDPKVTKAYLGS